jgi:2,5-diamino-6-(ribosylamino)-4(3H)-pyrimidinone 5'-phosphate reductase
MNRSKAESLPYILVNMAMTADGKIAMRHRAASSFGSATDKRHLLELRASADAVMAGARTVDSDDINLGPGPARFRRARVRRGLAPYNLRVIVSGLGRVNPKAEVFQRRFSPVIVLTTSKAGATRLRRLRRVADEVKVCGSTQVNIRRALAWLKNKWAVRRLVCEGGGELNDMLFRAGLVDELHLTICPLIFGGRDAPGISEGVGAATLAGAVNLELKSARRRGEEMFLVFQRAGPGARAGRRGGSSSG